MSELRVYSKRRKSTQKPGTLNPPKNIKLISTSINQALRTDFDTIELELENGNLKKMIGLLEGKNRVLEEHCNLLKEKNDYYHTKLRNMQTEEDNVDNDKVEIERDDTLQNQKATSLKDKISGVIFGVALPKLGTLFTKIKEKRGEIKSFVEEHGPPERGCPMDKPEFKAKIQAVKVNLFRTAILLGMLMIVGGVGYAGYKIWKNRSRNPHYLLSSDADEGSAKNLFRVPGSSSSNIPKTNSSVSLETTCISKDFKSILDRQ